jgi:ABC-type multidrug transport system fused ATPase/permease subunit
LIADTENVKVVQELMRHANSRTTLEVIHRQESVRSAKHSSGLWK